MTKFIVQTYDFDSNQLNTYGPFMTYKKGTKWAFEYMEKIKEKEKGEELHIEAYPISEWYAVIMLMDGSEDILKATVDVLSKPDVDTAVICTRGEADEDE